MQAPAIVTFHERDPSDVRAAARMEWFPYTELVTVPVLFTRMLYAQLALQEFHPPRNAPALPPEGHPGHKAAALGVKLTAGFEMLAADWARGCLPLPKPDCEEICSTAASACDSMSGDEADASRSAARILSACPAPTASEFGPEPGPEADDSEDWLSQGEALLDHALKRREEERTGGSGGQKNRADDEGDNTAEVAKQLDSAVQGLRAFLAAQGSAEGAHVPHAGKRNGSASGLNVDPTQFLRELSAALGVSIDRELGDGDDKDDNDDEGSSSDLSDDFDVETVSSAEEDDQPADAATGPAARGPSTRWNIVDGPDSDDDEDCSESDVEVGGTAFYDEYAAVLEEQLRETALHDDFERHQNAGGDEPPASERDASKTLAPVNVDLNLVKSLLASYTAQEGQPGPATNLLSMLGVGLPSTQGETSRE
jgi:hypothetical protein